jgi:ssDNA-binding Zn-finger/Zn-ribbon topoisomerase 1
MVTATCSACAKEVSREAATCPNCGQPNPALKKGMNGVIAIVILVIGGWWYLGGGLLSHAKDQVVEQAVEEYEIAQRSGDPIQACVHAGMVSAAYLQAQKEAKYQEWLGIQKRDCGAAGMPE